MADGSDVAGGLVCGFVALAAAVVLRRKVLAADTGTPEMMLIATAIQEGASAFLTREYKYLSYFVCGATVVLGIGVGRWQPAFCFVLGATISALTGWVGMKIAVQANVRTAAAAQTGLNPALRIAFNSGAVMGLSVVGSGMVGLSILSLMFDDWKDLAGFGFGASSIALFARVGGGIYTKAADVGTDLVGKVEAGIPEDDPRNPGVIADNVGDNVGDVAGMGADLFESYVGSIIAAATIAQSEEIHNGVALPFWIAGIGIIASIIGISFVRTGERASQEELLKAIRRGIGTASLILGISALPITLGLGFPIATWFTVLLGLGSGALIGFLTEYATSFAYRPTLSIAEATKTGPATVVIQGFAVGMLSAVPIAFVLGFTIYASYWLQDGIYGVALAPVGMLSTLGITLATDAYGPVADNAGGIAEMAGLPPEVRDRTDALDALGNTTAATGKGFAIGSAVLTALAIMSAFAQAVDLPSVDIVQSEGVIPGLIIGGVLPYFFAALTMMAVGKAAGEIIDEVRRQFREIPGLLQGSAKPDYARCVDISTRSSLREMVLPGAMAVITPIFVGLVLGIESLAGVLTGAIVSGFLLGVTMANAGGAWDNAKKYIEAGNMGGKRSDSHKAAVVGDTVGDPFKDTSGPSLNILIKLMTIISLVMAPLFISDHRGIARIIIIVALAIVGGYFAYQHYYNTRMAPTRYSKGIPPEAMSLSADDEDTFMGGSQPSPAVNAAVSAIHQAAAVGSTDTQAKRSADIDDEFESAISPAPTSGDGHSTVPLNAA